MSIIKPSLWRQKQLNGYTKTILLVEDEALLAMTEVRMLEKYGYQVITAYSGEEAVAAVGTSPEIDLVLMDINLGHGIAGTQAATLILEQRDLPLIFLSSHTEREVVEKTEGITSYGYIVKNSGETILIASIKMAFRLFEAKMKEREKDLALRESEERLALVLEGSQLGYWDWNIETGKVQRNARWAEMLGYTLAEIELTVTQWQSLHHPDDRDRAWQSIQDHLEGRTQQHNLEYRMLCKDGCYKWIQDIAKIVQHDPQGKPLRMSGTHTDITERKQAEEALRLSEEKYRGFVTQSFEAISRTELDHPVDISLPVEEQIDQIYWNAHMAECNQAMADMYNVSSPEAFVGVRLIDAHGGKDNPVNRATFRQFIANGYKSINDETVEYTLDGKQKCFLSNTVGAVENGHLVRLWGTAIDITERKQVEDALSVSEEKHRTIIQTAMDGFWLADLQGCLLEVNEAYCQMSGYSAQELLSMRIPDLEDIETAEDTAAHIQKAIVQGEDRFESRHRCKDGSVFDVEISVQYRPIEDGQIVCFLEDVTERKQAEEALQESEARYKALFEGVSDAIFIYDPDTFEILQANRATAQLYGYAEDELLGMSCLKFSAEVEQSKSVLAQIAREGRAAVPYRHHQKKDGSDLYVYLAGHKITVNGQDVFFTVCKDVTERKQAEEALEENKEKHRGLSDAAFEAIFISEKGICLEQNQMAGQMFGYSDAEAIGRYGTEWIVPEDRDTVVQNMLSGYEMPYEVTALRKDGSTFPAVIRGRMMRYQDRTVRVTSLQDITERKQAEEALRESEEKFRKSLEFTPTPIALAASNGNLFFLNKHFIDAYGYTLQDLPTTAIPNLNDL